MGLRMPGPVKDRNGVYKLRIRVPADVKEKTRGSKVPVAVDGAVRWVTAGDEVNCSLRTREAAKAKRRYAEALVSLNAHWQAVREGPQKLNRKTILALAGETHRAFVDTFDDDPGSPKLWVNVLAANERAQRGKANPLAIGHKDRRASLMIERFEPFVDAVLGRHALNVDANTRDRLIEEIAKALDESAKINLRKALGDYSDSGEDSRFPELDLKRPEVKPKKTTGKTFSETIDRKVEARKRGMGGGPLSEASINKYRKVAEEFAASRGGDDEVTTVMPEEVEAWKWDLLEDGALKSNTVRQRLTNLSTIIEWAKRQAVGSTFQSEANPVTYIELPDADSDVPEGERAYRRDEARRTLEAARKETAPELRWAPWICAYSGARIGEVSQLTPGDFFQIDGQYFYRITSKGGRTLKNRNSERRVPVHPDLMAEGLIDFVGGLKGTSDKPMFPKRTQGNVSRWLRKKVGITRKNLSPNHGWRHLFEDLAVGAGIEEGARNYITGRTTGKSGEGYGKSDARLPGLGEVAPRG